MTRPRTTFMLVRATTSWIGMTPAARHDFVDRTLRPILGRHGQVRLRYFDAEAYSASTSDVLMWEAADDADYRGLVEELRETAFWGTYFEVREIVPCVEEDFARHYGVEGFSSP
jgi:darcynin-like uncharacterized protein